MQYTGQDTEIIMAEHPPDSYKHILNPLAIGSVQIKHRIMVTGHTQLYGANGTLSQRHIDYYQERAKGGAALMILEQEHLSYVSPKF